MRVAFLNRGRETYPGGDLVALDATMEALRRRGVECVETGWQADKIKDFDLAHIFHCNFDWSYGNYKAVIKAGKKYVLTPLFYPDLLSGIDENELNDIFWGASAVIPFSSIEANKFKHIRYVGLDHIIPNGTSSRFHWHHNSNVSKREDSVLCVSARGPSDKNVQMVERICAKIQRKFVLAVNQPEIKYHLYSIFVNASISERMSLTIGEALCSGCRVLATQENWGNEWYPGIVTFDPCNENRLQHLILWALNSDHWDYRPNEAARQITWHWVAKQIHQVYEEVLA
jgi:glycosyltransferase involved in cell wall biosynthesis